MRAAKCRRDIWHVLLLIVRRTPLKLYKLLILLEYTTSIVVLLIRGMAGDFVPPLFRGA